MAKGFSGRGMPRGGSPMGGGFNMAKLQKIQQQIQQAQADHEQREFTAVSGGGAVSATVSGKHELRALTIDPDILVPEDAELLQDMIITAVNEAFRLADDALASGMQEATGGMNLGF